MTSLERLALSHVRAKYPNLQRGGFARAVRALEPGTDLDVPIPLRPDGWFAQHEVWEGGEGTTFICIEIEDSSLLTPAKLWHYADLWGALDYLSHDLRLLVFDRYGYNENSA